ncbi:MAG TPA: ferrous iron transport protein B [Acetivibrio sp.]|uniref:ferrous iron transport protein B n=1 Tax=Acetivibrio sp. TaxID=1872092 RepID=UPI002D1084FD|nr:ferrous iron transport protein B [Acetivibrio sp.]HOM02928.1 ferrous iron transport protein B [Acetivibrio sp.]
MGLTSESTGIGVLENKLTIVKSTPVDKVIALAGNPNVGKSTVFNSLTGLNQHTGNWPGKTVTNAQGRYRHKDKNFIMVDIPGTYSLMANSIEEEVARDFVCFGQPDATVVVTDATCLERNLNLVLQTLEITNKVVVCVNLIDEAERKKIKIDYSKLSKHLGVPVIPTNARSNKGLDKLMDAVYDISTKDTASHPIKITYDGIIEEAIEMVKPKIEEIAGEKVNSRWAALKLLDSDDTLLESLNNFLGFNLLDDEELSGLVDMAKKHLVDNGIGEEQLRDRIVTKLVKIAEEICRNVITFENKQYDHIDRKIDKILTSRIFGIPVMLAMLGVIFWITITGANYPSQMLSNFFSWIEERLTDFFAWAGTPEWVHGLLVLGVFRTVAWVVSVMLPPMAIFFPLFTLLEDLGYLPRVAFNLDNFFKKACAHGKQSLTMCMGFGCNAAGVIGCRIIDSPRERLIAVITNNFVPCNGRFPTLIAIITMFFVGNFIGFSQSVFSTLFLTGVILLGIVMTLLVSKLLSKTILKGLPSSFALELPPYRKPQIGRIIVRSIFDRTLFVLGRAVSVAIPAGLVIWIMANIHVEGQSLLSLCAGFLDPFAKLIGLDGYILMAFILGFPANEIVVPIIIMSYMSTTSMMELENLNQLKQLLLDNGWTWVTALCVMLFSLMHWPCSTTCLTIRKETQSWKWTLISILVPTLSGIVICFIVANLARLLALV